MRTSGFFLCVCVFLFLAVSWLGIQSFKGASFCHLGTDQLAKYAGGSSLSLAFDYGRLGYVINNDAGICGRSLTKSTHGHDQYGCFQQSGAAI